jgi:putative transposase
LSFRDIEEMLAMRGVALTYETVRAWCLKFGQTYANNWHVQRIRRRWQITRCGSAQQIKISR